MKEVEVVFEIGPDGEVKINVTGACGASCKELTKPYEELLGSVEVKELKDEYHSTAADTRQRAGQD